MISGDRILLDQDLRL